MDVKAIEALAKLMQETGLTALELSEEGMELKLERRQEAPVAVGAAPPPPPPIVLSHYERL